MRFIGNKEKLIGKIHAIMRNEHIEGTSIFDFFSGTTNVARYFKKLDYQVYSSDILYFSYVLQQAYIVNNEELKFEKLLSFINHTSRQFFSTPLDLVVEYLNQLKGKNGFIYNNYTPEGSNELDIPRMYFSNKNGQKIDAIRQMIETWKQDDLISKQEYFALITCLIETVPFYANISGVYAAFRKKWDPRAIKPLKLRKINFVFNQQLNFAYNTNSVELAPQIKTDIYYLDPPYNQRQYAPNYHILETIAKYDNPTIRGVTGLRNYDKQKSKFCNPNSGLKELEKIAQNGLFKTLILSYNSEGIMPQESILEILRKYGSVKLIEFDYLRFKSNSNGASKHRKYIKEQLYILRK